MSIRLELACETGLFIVPLDGTILVLYPRGDMDLSQLPPERVLAIQPMRPDHDALAKRGFEVRPEIPDGIRFSAAIVCIPRSKVLARSLVAEAAMSTDGPVVIDGAKTDGIDSLLKDVRKRVQVEGPISKAHGKIFVFSGTDAFGDWRAGPANAGRFVTAAGSFSVGEIDPASALLAEVLPDRIGRHVADLGAGWGFLSDRILQDPGVETVHLVEADFNALQAAKVNIQDPRARFHWSDARKWTGPDAGDGPLDTIVMNPPFHESRSADPALGRAFIEAAARLLTPSGTLWLVANRHLPYETTLRTEFQSGEEFEGTSRFKVFRAQRPSRRRR